MAGPGRADIRISGGRYTQSDSAGAESARCGCGRTGRPTRWGAYWRNLANVTELSVFGGDASLCQITVITCLQVLLSRTTTWNSRTFEYFQGRQLFSSTLKGLEFLRQSPGTLEVYSSTL